MRTKKFVTADKVKEVYYSVFREGKEFNPNKMIRYLTPIVGEKPARQITIKTQEAFVYVLNTKFKEDVLNEFRQFFNFNDIRNNCIMYSLSETYSNNHQWTIYADNGKGFCIGYEILPKTKKKRVYFLNYYLFITEKEKNYQYHACLMNP